MGSVAERPSRPVFSLWTWALLTPIVVTAYGAYDAARSDAQRLAGFGIAVLVHLLLGFAFLAAAAIERRIAGYSRWIAFVIIALVVMSVARPLALRGLQLLSGLPPVTTEMWVRMVMNFLLLGTALLVVAFWLRASDRSTVSRARLRAVLRRRAEDIRGAEQATDRIVREFTDSVAAPVLDALRSAREGDPRPAEQSERLRAIAHDVVRPLSHRVFDTVPAAEPVIDAPPIEVERVAQHPPKALPERIVLAPGWVPVVIILIVSVPAVFGSYPLWVGVVRLAVGAAVGVLLTLALRLLPLRHGWVAAAIYGLGYLAIGIAIAWALLSQTWPWSPAATVEVTVGYWLYVIFGFTLVAVIASLASSLRADAIGAERTLARALEFAEEAAADSRARLERTTNDIARVLHNQVQGDILATSLQLRMGIADEHAVDELIAQVDRALHEPAAARAAERSAQEVRDAANAAIVAWSRVMDVTSQAAEPACWRWLADHPDATALFLDANAEALTNAARHAAAPTADLRLELIPGGVRMLARNPGRLVPGRDDGVGIRDLRRRGAHVSLVQEDPRTVLLTVDLVDAAPTANPLGAGA